MYSNKGLKYLLLFSNGMFLLLYLVLIWNNRLAIDDYYFLYKFNEYGIVQSVVHDYQTWSTRWTCNFLTHFILALDQQTGKGLFIFGLINLLVFITSVFILIKSILYLIDRSYKLSFGLGMQIAVFIVSILFISTIRIGETWFWLCASCTYLFANMMFLLGFASILYHKRNVWLTLIGLVAFIYIGGSSEPLAIITLFILSILVVLLATKKFIFPAGNEVILFRLIAAILFCLISFMILYLGPGIRKREGFFEEMGIIHRVVLNFKMTGIIFIKRLPFMLPYMSLLGLGALLVGFKFQKSKAKAKGGWGKNLIYLSLAYLLIVFIYQFPITFITYDVAAYRALMIVNIFTAAYMIAFGFILGQHIRLENKRIASMMMITFLLSTFIFGAYFVKESRTVFKYAASVDKRMEFLHTQTNTLGVIELPPLESSGMLFSAELSKDTAYFSNYHFRKAMYLKAAIRLK